MTNRKSRTRFRLVPKSTTLDDPEGPLHTLFQNTCVFRDTVLLWLKKFYSMRTHQTRVEFSLSDIAQLLSGVVQGSGIVPPIFLLYISELIAILESFY